jgi:hypothetical protein
MGKRFTAEQLEVIKKEVTSPEELQLLMEADDPILWSEKHLFHPDNGKTPFQVKEMFYGLIRDSRKNRAGRVGRQSGKTVHLCVDMMHVAVTNTNGILMTFVPEKKNMNRMLEIMKNLLRGSDLKASFRMGKKKKSKSDVDPEYDYEISVSSGSVIRFFFMSHHPDKARGQRGTHIYVDEAEYLPDKAWPVITGIVKSNPDMPIWASSTPSGLEGTWFRDFCDQCKNPNNHDGEEYHLSSKMEKNWPEIEKRLRTLIFDPIIWQLEVLAEWAEAKGAVYRKDAIDESVERSRLGTGYVKAEEIMQTLEYTKAKKFLGVDWNNPQNGVRLVEVARMDGKPWVVRNEIISYEEYTQLTSVDRIIELYKENRYEVISLDAGYGSTQIELIQKKLIEMGKEPNKILNIVDSGKKEETTIEYTSPETGARKKEKIVTRVKNKIVALLEKYIESNIVLMKEHDESREGLVKEIRNFRRKGANRDGGFQYSEGTHSLSALQINMHGYDNYIRNENMPEVISVDIMQSEALTTIIRKRMDRTRTGGLTRGQTRRSIL